MPGFLFFNLPVSTGTTLDPASMALLDILQKYGARNLTELSYNASYAACMYMDTMDYKDMAWRNKSFDFCYSDTYGYCSMLVFNTYDEFQYSVSNDYYQVNRGACNDTFSISDDAWEKLLETPPTSLIELYYECVMTVCS
jgi:hypothetical protein